MLKCNILCDIVLCGISVIYLVMVYICKKLRNISKSNLIVFAVVIREHALYFVQSPNLLYEHYNYIFPLSHKRRIVRIENIAKRVVIFSDVYLTDKLS